MKNRQPFLLKTELHFLFVALALLLGVQQVTAQDTAFTYQGQLQNNGSPANGLYDLRFMVWDALTNGNMVAGPLTNSATGVTNGLFTVTLDFGPGVFTGPARWLELDVRTNGSGAFTTLLPLQQFLPMPYSIMANTASNLLGTLPAAQVVGNLALAQLPPGLTNLATGGVAPGLVLTNVMLASPNSRIAADAPVVTATQSTNYLAVMSNTNYASWAGNYNYSNSFVDADENNDTVEVFTNAAGKTLWNDMNGLDWIMRFPGSPFDDIQGGPQVPIIASNAYAGWLYYATNFVTNVSGMYSLNGINAGTFNNLTVLSNATVGTLSVSNLVVMNDLQLTTTAAWAFVKHRNWMRMRTITGMAGLTI